MDRNIDRRKESQLNHYKRKKGGEGEGEKQHKREWRKIDQVEVREEKNKRKERKGKTIWEVKRGLK